MDAEVSRVFVKRFDLNTAFFVFNTFGTIKRCGYIVIRYSNGFFRRAHFATRHAQPFKGLWARHLMDKVAVNIQ